MKLEKKNNNNNNMFLKLRIKQRLLEHVLQKILFQSFYFLILLVNFGVSEAYSCLKHD